VVVFLNLKKPNPLELNFFPYLPSSKRDRTERIERALTLCFFLFDRSTLTDKIELKT
jgi:hypothetical protein